MRPNHILMAGIIAFAALSGARAQTFSVDWFTVDGGGGSSTSGSYVVSGTIGQPDASNVMTGGVYSVAGGFWPGAIAVQVPGAPLLFVIRAGTNVLVSWTPATPGFVLQHSPTLVPVGWQSAPTGATNPIAIPVGAAYRFYRLLKP